MTQTEELGSWLCEVTSRPAEDDQRAMRLWSQNSGYLGLQEYSGLSGAPTVPPWTHPNTDRLRCGFRVSLISNCFLLGRVTRKRRGPPADSCLDDVVLDITTTCTRIIHSAHGLDGPVASAFTVGAGGQLGRVSGGKVGSQGHQGSRIRAQAQPHGEDPQQEGTAGGGPCPLDVPLGPSLVGL